MFKFRFWRQYLMISGLNETKNTALPSERALLIPFLRLANASIFNEMQA